MTTTSDTPTTAAPDAVPPNRAERLHDLDALRGFAMLLGIALHASLAFFPAVWPVQDRTVDEANWFDELEAAIHGFRMPLFFLLSGFFTTMVWRRRGLGSLARQRALRVVGPLALGMLTIVPIMETVTEQALENEQANADILTAVFLDDADRVAELVAAGQPVDEADDEGGTLLHLAAYLGNPDIVATLIDAGADVDARLLDGIDPDGRTPLENAIAAGHEDIADALVAAGAEDPRQPGDAWRDVEGWGLFPPQSGETGRAWTELHHLWFLWYLTLLVIGFLVIASTLERFPPSAGVARWTGRLMWLLVPATVVVQYGMTQNFGRYFGPASATSLRPSVWILLYYAIFFGFGALVYDRRGRGGEPLVRTLGIAWPATLLAALALALPIGLDLIRDESAGLVPALTAQMVYTWLMIFGLMGLFRHFLAVERRGVRYLSDSAYWLYLAHLPIVIVFQDLIRDWDLPAATKFLGICAVVTVILLVTYQLFVRYTPLGWLLNGRRYPTYFDLPWLPRKS